jgi:hypothetical protein
MAIIDYEAIINAYNLFFYFFIFLHAADWQLLAGGLTTLTPTRRCVKVREGGQALNMSNELNATQIIIE